jgi:hypothetical protein
MANSGRIRLTAVSELRSRRDTQIHAVALKGPSGTYGTPRRKAVVRLGGHGTGPPWHGPVTSYSSRTASEYLRKNPPSHQISRATHHVRCRSSRMK